MQAAHEYDLSAGDYTKVINELNADKALRVVVSTGTLTGTNDATVTVYGVVSDQQTVALTALTTICAASDTQYITEVNVLEYDAISVHITQNAATGGTVTIDLAQYVAAPSGAGGASDHGALTGLGDDDHTQYHNDARGDARYSLLAHTHTASQVTDFDTEVANNTNVAANTAAQHARSHAITSTSDHTAGAWKIFASNGSGEIEEIGNGTDGQVLTAQPGDALPVWETPAAGITEYKTINTYPVLCAYDSVRSKWLSVAQPPMFFSESTVNALDWVRRSGTAGDASTGYPAVLDGTIIGWSIQVAGTFSSAIDLDLYINGAKISTLKNITANGKWSSYSLNIDYNKNDHIQVRGGAIGDIDDTVVDLYTKHRHTT